MRKRGYRVLACGGASNSESLPGEEKDDPTITCGWIKEAHADGRIVIWKHDVYAGRGTDNVPGLSIVHLPDGVGEGAGGVDHAFGFHLKFLPGELVPAASSTDFTLAVLCQ